MEITTALLEVAEVAVEVETLQRQEELVTKVETEETLLLQMLLHQLVAVELLTMDNQTQCSKQQVLVEMELLIVLMDHHKLLVVAVVAELMVMLLLHLEQEEMVVVDLV